MIGSTSHGIRAAFALAVALAVGGCALFEPDRPKPVALEPIASPATVATAWTQNIGAVNFPLVAAAAGGNVVVASGDGNVVALDAASGREAWRAAIGAPLSAGVGSDGRISAVVTRGGELVAIENGQVKWRRAVGARVATAPLVAGDRVFVLGVDRSVQGFDGSDGAPLMQMRRAGDPLSLTQTGVVAAFRDTLVVGQGPRLAGLDPRSAAIRWEVAIGSPRGANEIERLADLVGPAVRTGDLYCARSFQAAVGCVDAERGRLFWTKAIGGTEAIAGNRELLVGADAADRITAWRTPSGEVAWTSEALMHHRLGPAALAGDYAVFGAIDGTLHWLAGAGGAARARVPTDGSALAGQPVVVDGVLVAVTRKGGVFAFRP